MRRIRHVVAFAVAVMMINCAVARADVLQQVPADALVLLKVNNLKATSDKVAKLAADLGLAAMAPPLADPLGALQEQIKITAGIDTAGDMAFVFVDPATLGGDAEKSMLILIPVTDYQAFLGNWPDAKTTGGVSEVKLADNPAPGYVAQWGNYAALAPAAEIVARKPSAMLKAPAMTAKELAGKDAVLYANFVALRQKLLPQLAEGRQTLLGHVEQALQNEPNAQKFAPVAKAALNQVVNIAERFMQDSDAATIGIGLVPEGINFTVASEFAQGTYLAQTFAGLKNTDAPLLAGLPDGKYLVFGGGVNDPAAAGKMVGDLLDPIVKELIAVGPEFQGVQEYVDALKAYSEANRGQVFGVIAPTGAVGTDPLLQFVSITEGDAAAMTAACKKMMTSMEGVVKGLNLPGAANMTPQYTANAKTIDGVSFDSYVTKVDMNAQDPMAMQQAQMMNMLYGPQGQVVMAGAMGDKLLLVSGLSDDWVSKAIGAVKSGEAPLMAQERVKAVAAQLPKKRLGVVYIPVDDVVTTALSYAKQFGFGLQLQLPPDLPPVGVTVGTEGTVIRIDAHVPTTLVQSLVAAGMQAAMQMQGGQQPGGGL